jgi:hypothetical protein
MRRQRLDRATKHAYRAAARAGKPIGWAEARIRGATLCAVRPNFFDGDTALSKRADARRQSAKAAMRTVHP